MLPISTKMVDIVKITCYAYYTVYTKHISEHIDVIQHGSLQLLNWKHSYLSFSTEKIIKRETFFFFLTQLEHTAARSGRPRGLHWPVFHPFLHNEQNKNKPRTTALPRLTPRESDSQTPLKTLQTNYAFAEVSDILLSINSKLTTLSYLSQKPS